MMQTKKKNTKRIPNPYARKILIALRLNPDEMRMVLSKAQAFNGGNVSEFVRHSVLNFKLDKKGQLK